MASKLVYETVGGEVTAFLPDIYDSSSDFLEIVLKSIKKFAKSKGFDLFTIRVTASYEVDIPKEDKKPSRVSCISNADLKIYQVDDGYMAILDIISSSRVVY
jgi:hypothetical protein